MPTTARALLTLLALTAGASALAHDGDPKLLHKRPAYAGAGWRNAQRQSTSGGPLLVVGPNAQFTASNVTLLAWITLPEFGVNAAGNGNSCFGYTSPSGREYALMGLSTGTAVVEVTQPGNPVIVAQIPGPVSLWRDVRTYSTYAYAVSEGGGGIQVIDLANVDAGTVTLVGTVHDDAWGQTHTVALDTVSGYLYRSGGAGQGLRIYDVHTNPAQPARVGTWSDRYVHEPTVVTFTSGPASGKQVAYCCGGLSNGYVNSGLYVVDVTNKAAPAQLAYLSYANVQYAHQCWPSPDLRWLYLDDELDDHYLGITSVTRVFDLANPLAPVLAGTFTNGNTAIDHNQYTRDDRIYQASYRAGLRVFQTSAPGTPTSPVEVAYFDTWPEDDGTFFNSLWNVYPYFPSGTVIGSDIEKGLFVWWVGTPPVTFALPGGEREHLSVAGDLLRVQVTGAIQPGSAELHWNAGSGPNTTSLVQAPNGDWIAALPPLACGATLRYSFSARSTNGVLWSEPAGAPDLEHEAAIAFAQTIVHAHDGETGAQGWTSGAPGDTAVEGLWVLGDPNGTDLQPENDHTPIGTQCWFTGQNPPGTVHLGDVDGGVTTLLSPVFALANAPGARVSYWRWYDDQVPTGSLPDDPFQVDVTNDGTNWVNVETIGPSDANSRGGWIRHEFRVADFVPTTNAVRVRFVARDLVNDTHVEAAIDDVRVVSDECSGYARLCAGDGTGAACPCGNTGAPGRGCASSVAGGAELTASGTASITNDTLVLSGASMPATGTVLYLQADTADGAGLGTPLGDGLRCVTGSVVRLGTKHNAGGASQFPDAGDPALHVVGGTSAGQTRYYQAWYRNAANWCTSATYNWSNAIAVGWGL